MVVSSTVLLALRMLATDGAAPGLVLRGLEVLRPRVGEERRGGVGENSLTAAEIEMALLRLI